MSGRKIITASLEGMRVLADEKGCELQEYDFVANRWLSKDQSLWPVPRSLADSWLEGWNHVDRFAAVNILTEPPENPAGRRSPGRLGPANSSRPLSHSPIWCNVVKNMKGLAP
jgi:hypothetical protein